MLKLLCYNGSVISKVLRRTTGGAGILLVLLIVPILVFLARSVHWLAQSGAHRVGLHNKRVVAQYLLQAGKADTLAHIKQDADWSVGFREKSLDDVNGSYSVIFNQPGQAYQVGQSVNNITGTTSRDGPRGPGTVRPGSIELVVLADSQGHQATGQTIFVAKTKPLPAYGLGASGKILLQGNVSVRGVENLISEAPVDAGIHANSLGAAGPAIRWVKNNTANKMIVKGRVTTSAGAPDSISLQGTSGRDYQIEGIETGAAQLPVPTANIVDTVGINSALPPPPFQNFGTSRLGPGKSYAKGSVELQGDLRLNGHTLYVDGDLIVNGTIAGVGSVYVTGKTRLKGDTKISSSETGVALFSHGAVELTGFDGQEFLNRLRVSNSGVNSALSQYDGSLVRVTGRRVKGGGNLPGEYYDDRRAAQIPALLSAFRRSGAKGETADFIKRQLTDYVVKDTSAPVRIPGMGGYGYRLNTPIQGKLRKGRPPSYDLAKIGQAYFQGLIVSDHYVLTDNAVSVVGGVWATGDYDSDPVTVDGRTVNPGDIVANNGTEIVLNRALLEDPETQTRDVTDFELRAYVK